MKKLGLLVLVPILGLSFLFYGCRNTKTAVGTTQTAQVNAKEITYQGQDGKTALELLEASHKVDSSTSSVGVMVKSIDGVSQTDKEFWLYDVNGAQSDVGADKYQTKSADMIRWQLKGF